MNLRCGYSVVLKLEAISADLKSIIPGAGHPSKDQYGNDQKQAAEANPTWRFHKVHVEQVVPGSKKRSDLVVYGDGPALCGEIRLPDHQFSSPLDFDNLKDAVDKAQAHGCRWAFTSDAKSLFLIDTLQTGCLHTTKTA